MTTKTITLYDDEDAGYSVEAPARWEICGKCDGEGHHSNPAIDGNGITQSEWAEWDPEERHSYMRGDYDVQCQVCGGSGKVCVVNQDSFEKQNPEDFRRWQKSEADDAEYRDITDSETRWERRMLYGSDY